MPSRLPSRVCASIRLQILEKRLVPAPFVEPPVLQSVNGMLSVTLTEDMEPVVIDGQTVTGAWTYNGNYVGPTLKANPGDVIDILLENDLDQVTNIHTHGLHVSPIGNGDNVLLTIQPGENNHYHIPIPLDHPEGLFWYHPHRHGFVDEQVYRGLSGLIVIGRADGNYPELDSLPQRTFALTNIQIDGNNTVVPPGDAVPGQMKFLVNGLQNPTLTMQPGETQIWNVGNIGNIGFYNLSLGGSTFYIVRDDGTPMTEPVAVQELVLPPAKRYSIIVTAPTQTGTFQFTSLGHFDGFNAWPATTLATVDVSGTLVPPFTIPSHLGTRDDLTHATIAQHRELKFDQGPDSSGQFVFTINGKRFPDVPLIQPRLNTVEEWTLLNPTTDQHPFHHHIDDFQVMSINDQPVPPRHHQDVVNVPAFGNGQPGKVVIRVRYTDFIGAAVYHCHRLDHEDLGMMGLMTILPEKPLIATGTGDGSSPHVKVYDAFTNELYASFFAFAATFLGGVRVAVGDVNGDAIPDIIAAEGPGGGPHVKVVDGTKLGEVGPDGMILDSALLLNFFAYAADFTGGVNVAGADIDTDGLVDVVTGAGETGGPHVKVFAGSDGSVVASFFAYAPTYWGGVNVAVGDVNGDGRFDIVTGAGKGGGPHVKLFSGPHLVETLSFFAYDATFFGGVYVATAPVQGAAYADIITGAGQGGGPHVKAFRYDAESHGSGSHGGHRAVGNGASFSDDMAGAVTLISSFMAYDITFFGGVRVSGALTATGADFFVGPGPGGEARVKRFHGPTSIFEESWIAYDMLNPAGVFVGG